MGVFPIRLALALLFFGLPHGRGGVSLFTRRIDEKTQSSPRAWGCFYRLLGIKKPSTVFPTGVGVFLHSLHLESIQARLPHGRGGVSTLPAFRVDTGPSSPRAWGCFSPTPSLRRMRRVFPTGVGVFLVRCKWCRSCFCLPHGRGGVSTLALSMWNFAASSPRAWGCFSPWPWSDPAGVVFPTGVGVFPAWSCRHRGSACLPHGRGGVSPQQPVSGRSDESSPRAWGCFPLHLCLKLGYVVFPTGVGVFLDAERTAPAVAGLPHGRGGVSVSKQRRGLDRWSSPRAWGCFRLFDAVRWRVLVFPTGVGVFPRYADSGNQAIGLPHGRGGVSACTAYQGAQQMSSPRAWGCFLRVDGAWSGFKVFPTGVGVFPKQWAVNVLISGLPHGRGGVSDEPLVIAAENASSPRAWGCFHSPTKIPY